MKRSNVFKLKPAETASCYSRHEQKNKGDFLGGVLTHDSVSSNWKTTVSVQRVKFSSRVGGNSVSQHHHGSPSDSRPKEVRGNLELGFFQDCVSALRSKMFNFGDVNTKLQEQIKQKRG